MTKDASKNTGLQVTKWLTPNYWGMWLFMALLRLIALLPLSIIQSIGSFLGWSLYRLVPSRRRIARINIKQAYPGYSDEQIKQLVKSSFMNMGISVFDMAIAWWARRDYLRKRCSVEGLEHLEQALAKGNGVILLTGHFSTLEIGGILMALYTPLQAIYKKAHNPMFETFMTHYRSKHLERVTVNTNVRGFIKGLKDGLATWFAPDQDMIGKDIVFAPFLGGTASTLTSTTRMSELTGAPIVPFYPIRLPHGEGYKLIILPELENFPTGDINKDAALVNKSIEEMVYANPEQYAWIHKRFKTQPDGKPSIY